MTSTQWCDAVDGLMAYDHGCVDSGIRDCVLKERAKRYWDGSSREDQNKLILKMLKRYIGKEESWQGYGIEDALGVLEYINNGLEV